VRISGRPSDPPLILLHGARGHSLTWVPNIAALSAHYRTYAVDSIHDIGLSASRQHNGKLDYYLQWWASFAELVPEDRSISWALRRHAGSPVCAASPERVRKLVLLSPAATVLPVSMGLIMRAALTVIPHSDFRRKFYYWLLNDSVQGGDAGRAFVDQAVADWAVADRCFGRLPLTAATVIDDRALQAFEVPTLFLVGEHEKIYSAAKAVARLKRVAPQIKAEIIPGRGTICGRWRQKRLIERYSNSWEPQIGAAGGAPDDPEVRSETVSTYALQNTLNEATSGGAPQNLLERWRFASAPSVTRWLSIFFHPVHQSLELSDGQQSSQEINRRRMPTPVTPY
jgi:pimeloyl-ACP methyl ester carboxylesterase